MANRGKNVLGVALPATLTLRNETGGPLRDCESNTFVDDGETFNVSGYIYGLVYRRNPLVVVVEDVKKAPRAKKESVVSNASDSDKSIVVAEGDTDVGDTTSTLRAAFDNEDTDTLKRLIKERGLSVPRSKKRILALAGELLSDGG